MKKWRVYNKLDYLSFALLLLPSSLYTLQVSVYYTVFGGISKTSAGFTDSHTAASAAYSPAFVVLNCTITPAKASTPPTGRITAMEVTWNRERSICPALSP